MFEMIVGSISLFALIHMAISAAVILVFIYVIRQIFYFLKLRKMIATFQYELNDEKVIQFTNLLRKKRSVPNNPSVWDTLRAGFEMVAYCKNVSDGVKMELRNALLAKGVNRLKNINSKMS